MTLLRRAGLLLLLIAALASAQGRYSQGSGRNASKSPTRTQNHKYLAGTFHGVVKQISKKEIVIQTAEDQTVVIRLSKNTKFLKSGREIKSSSIDLDSPVAVDATQDIDLKPTALSVTVETAAQ